MLPWLTLFLVILAVLDHKLKYSSYLLLFQHSSTCLPSPLHLCLTRPGALGDPRLVGLGHHAVLIFQLA